MNTGQRLKALRESLDPEVAKWPVGRRTLDRCYDRLNRWGHMEDNFEEPTANEAMLRQSVQAVLDCLDVSAEQARDAMRFVMGEVDSLPWERAAWAEGKSPVRRFGGNRCQRAEDREPAGEVIVMPPLPFEVRALLRAYRGGEVDELVAVEKAYKLFGQGSYYNKHPDPDGAAA